MKLGMKERRGSRGGKRRGLLENSPTVPAEQVLFNAVRGTLLSRSSSRGAAVAAG